MTVHCPTCRCDEIEIEPFNHCEVAGYGCLGDGVPLWRLAACYGCGLPVCRGEECSEIVMYGPVQTMRGKKWTRVRLCDNCIIERGPWGWVRGYEPNHN